MSDNLFKSRTKIGKALQNDRVIHCIYLISFEGSDKIYVGSTKAKCGIKERLRNHIRDLKNICNIHHSYKLQFDFNKFGLENMYFQIIEIFPTNFQGKYVEKILEREQYWIDNLNVVDNGYNISKKAVCYHKKRINNVIGRIDLINNFFIANGVMPNTKSKDKEEKYIATLYVNLVQDYKHECLNKKYIEYGKNSKIPLFWEDLLMINGYQRIALILEFRKNNKRNPSSNILEEKYLFNAFQEFRQNSRESYGKLFNHKETIKLINQFEDKDFLKKRTPLKNEKIYEFVVNEFKKNNNYKIYKLKYEDFNLESFIVEQRTRFNLINKRAFKEDLDKLFNQGGLKGILRPQNVYFTSIVKWQPGLGRGFSFDLNFTYGTTATEWWNYVLNCSQEEIEKYKIDVKYAQKHYNQFLNKKSK